MVAAGAQRLAGNGNESAFAEDSRKTVDGQS